MRAQMVICVLLLSCRTASALALPYPVTAEDLEHLPILVNTHTNGPTTEFIIFMQERGAWANACNLQLHIRDGRSNTVFRTEPADAAALPGTDVREIRFEVATAFVPTSTFSLWSTGPEWITIVYELPLSLLVAHFAAHHEGDAGVEIGATASPVTEFFTTRSFEEEPIWEKLRAGIEEVKRGASNKPAGR